MSENTCAHCMGVILCVRANINAHIKGEIYMRVQFYPTERQVEKLTSEAEKQGVSISVLLTDIVNKYYGLVEPNAKTEAQLEIEVLNEIAEYVSDEKNTGTEFDLNKASKTYTEIDMTYEGKPKIVKARIGKKFAKEIGKPGRFSKVQQVFLPNGNLKRTVGNRAAIYHIVE